MISEKDSVSVVKDSFGTFPKALVMLGSGWNKVIDEVEIEGEIPYKKLFGVEASVPGHDGKLIVGKLEGNPVAFMAGRIHMYEGYSAHEATLPIRVFSKLGVEKVVITSASGGINSKYKVGDIVILNDIITILLPSNPLVGPKFQDLSQAFDAKMRKTAIEVASSNSLPFQEGVYMYLPGPHYESPADKKAVKILGADCVGMSTVPETIQAKNLGMKVLGLSFVTNLAFVKHSHKEVVMAANNGSKHMVILLKGILGR